MVVDRLVHQFMHVGTDCSWLDERTDLNVVGTIDDKSTALFIYNRYVVRE